MMHSKAEVLKAVTEAGYYDIVELTNINVLDIDGDGILHKIVAMDDLELLKSAIELGADINLKGDASFSPLHQCIFYERLEMANYLIDCGASKNVEDEFGRTPEQFAKIKQLKLNFNDN